MICVGPCLGSAFLQSKKVRDSPAPAAGTCQKRLLAKGVGRKPRLIRTELIGVEKAPVVEDCAHVSARESGNANPVGWGWRLSGASR